MKILGRLYINNNKIVITRSWGNWSFGPWWGTFNRKPVIALSLGPIEITLEAR